MPFFKHTVEAKTLISASAADVWDTLIDTQNYHAWSSMLFWLEGEIKKMQ